MLHSLLCENGGNGNIENYDEERGLGKVMWYNLHKLTLGSRSSSEVFK